MRGNTGSWPGGRRDGWQTPVVAVFTKAVQAWWIRFCMVAAYSVAAGGRCNAVVCCLMMFITQTQSVGLHVPGMHACDGAVGATDTKMLDVDDCFLCWPSLAVQCCKCYYVSCMLAPEEVVALIQSQPVSRTCYYELCITVPGQDARADTWICRVLTFSWAESSLSCCHPVL